MPRQVQPLTQLQVRNAKAKDKPYKLADGGGLYLEVMPSGGKLWRMKFRQADGKENRLAFGAFPDVSLVDARANRDEARQARLAPDDAQQVAAGDRGGNPVALRVGHLSGVRVSADRYGAAIRCARCDPGHRETRCALEIANRQTANCSRVFKHANRCGLVSRNPAEFLREVLQPREKWHVAAMGADGLPEFLRAVYANRGVHGSADPCRDAIDAAGVYAH